MVESSFSTHKPETWSLTDNGITNPYGSGSKMSWLDYEKLRPTYPPLLYDVVAEYMKQHNHSGRDFCVDYGTGNGVIVPGLIERCGIHKVLGTDIATRQLAEGKERLQLTFGNERHDTLVGSAGDLTSIQDNSVNLVIAAEAAHWFNKEKWFKEAARILKPSGTLAIWHYWAEPIITSHPEATPVFINMWERREYCRR